MPSFLPDPHSGSGVNAKHVGWEPTRCQALSWTGGSGMKDVAPTLRELTP